MDAPEVSDVKSILVEHWENAFHVSSTSSEVHVYVEVEDTHADPGLWNHIPMRYGKKYVMIFKVPIGYIDVFLRAKTKS